MLDAWGDHPAVRRTLAEASAALGEDIAALIHQGPKEALELTTNTQPVMLTAAIACYNAWRAEGGAEPAAVAGHSLGEYSALVAAGALTLADALPLVRFRAQAMQQAVPVGAGAMAAILGWKRLRCAKPVRRGRCRKRRGGGARQLQRPQADRDRRQQGRRGPACESSRAWAPSAPCCWRCRRPFTRR
jgi:malonyl CoA-acyl carrier protein transacylase